MAKRLGLFVFGMLLLFTSRLACAQDMEDFKRMNPEENAKLITDWMQSALTLEEDQVAPVYAVNLKYAQKNRAIANSGDRKLRLLNKLKSASREKDKELRALFTQDQYRRYQEKKEEMKTRVKQKMQEKKR